jgi:hypothetical protein
MNEKNAAWPTWQQAMKNGTLPHEYVEKMKRTADSIQANRLDYMPRTFAEVLVGKPRIPKHDYAKVNMTPMTATNAENGHESEEQESGSESSNGTTSNSDADEAKKRKCSKRAAKHAAKKENKRKKETKGMRDDYSRTREIDGEMMWGMTQSARAELTFTPNPRPINDDMPDKMKIKIAKQAKARNDEATGIAKISDELAKALHDEFGMMLTATTKIDGASEDYGLAPFWYMHINRVKSFTEKQYGELYQKMQDPEKISHPQHIVEWLDRYFKAFAIAGEPVREADKTRIFLRLVETKLGREMVTYIRRLPREYRIDEGADDYAKYVSAILMQMKHEIDFPTPRKLLTATQENDDKERIRILEEKLAKMVDKNQRERCEGKTKTTSATGLHRPREKDDPPEIWEPSMICAVYCLADTLRSVDEQ